MNRQIFYLLTFVVVLMEFIQLSSTHKLVKIRKFYRPNKPWRRRLHWHLPSYLPIHISKKKAPWKPRYHPQHHRPTYSSHFTTIEIEFPKHIERNDQFKDQNLWMNREFSSYDPELIHEDNNQWIIQSNPKLQIKISRGDKLENDQEFFNISSSGVTQRSIYEDRDISLDQFQPMNPILFHNWQGG